MQSEPELAFSRIPLLPKSVLRRHFAFEWTDSRFRAAARLLQALWREERQLPIGYHVRKSGKRRKLGSRIGQEAAAAGANFLSAEIAQLAAREVVYQEEGALIDHARLTSNLLSSMPAVFNIFGPLKLDLDLASAVLRDLFPWMIDRVEAVHFEHSPGRNDPSYTGDHSAFDVLVRGRSEDGRRTFVAVEVKYSETMLEPAPSINPRLDEIARTSNLFRNPDDPALRANPIQQLRREHLLARAMVDKGDFDDGVFVVIAPVLNAAVQNAVKTYKAHLQAPELGTPAFHSLTMEAFIEALAEAGATAHARAVWQRYCDFGRVVGELEQRLFSALMPKRIKSGSRRQGIRPAAAG